MFMGWHTSQFQQYVWDAKIELPLNQQNSIKSLGSDKRKIEGRLNNISREEKSILFITQSEVRLIISGVDLR